MIKFHIERFKCFRKASVPLNRLTVLCGTNGSGKSSIIQALLLYRSAVLRQGKPALRINGTFGLSLGTVGNLLCQRMGGAEDDAGHIRFGFSEADEISPDYLVLDAGGDEGTEARQLTVLQAPRNPQFEQKTRFAFTYLSAERLGPRLSQERFSDEEVGNQSIGTRGQFTAECLVTRERTKIRPELRYEFREKSKGADALLLQATQDWLSSIVGPIEIRVSRNGNAPPSLYFKRPGVYDDWVVSTNTGFGISYALPIVVAGLLAHRGGTLIIDSPEAHLHPAAQTAVAKFLAWVASSGVQVIVETHSDHIIDGFRLATVREELRLRASECTIVNVQRDEEDTPDIQVLSIKENGSLSIWPKGFFDQQTKNFRAIADAVRSKSVE